MESYFCCWCPHHPSYRGIRTCFERICKVLMIVLTLEYRKLETNIIAMASYWARWRHKSLTSRLFTQPFIQGADQRKYQSSTSPAFVREIHRWPVNSPQKGQVTRKMFPFDDVIMFSYALKSEVGICEVAISIVWHLSQQVPHLKLSVISSTDGVVYPQCVSNADTAVLL